MIDLLAHTARVSLPLLLVPTAVLLVAVAWGREAFRQDYPEDIQALMAPPTRQENLRAWILGPAFLLSLLGAVGVSTWLFVRDGAAGFAMAYAVAFAGFMAFVLIDLVLVDWVVICAWRPRWVVVPGTEHCEGWGDYAFHARVLATPKAVLAQLVLPLPVAAAAFWLA